jgi:hypothetical protein
MYYKKHRQPKDPASQGYQPKGKKPHRDQEYPSQGIGNIIKQTFSSRAIFALSASSHAGHHEMLKKIVFLASACLSSALATLPLDVLGSISTTTTS